MSVVIMLIGKIDYTNTCSFSVCMMADEEDSASRKFPSDSYGDERPMKKARYVWQIKGKYRLKQPRG